MKMPRKQKKKLKSSHPLILVYYVSIGNLQDRDVLEYIQKVADAMDNPEYNFLKYFIPIRGGDSKVECINPVQINSKMYAKVVEQLEENKNKLNDFLTEIKSN